jgi:hypothetical protein
MYWLVYGPGMGASPAGEGWVIPLVFCWKTVRPTAALPYQMPYRKNEESATKLPVARILIEVMAAVDVLAVSVPV